MNRRTTQTVERRRLTSDGSGVRPSLRQSVFVKQSVPGGEAIALDRLGVEGQALGIKPLDLGMQSVTFTQEQDEFCCVVRVFCRGSRPELAVVPEASQVVSRQWRPRR